MNTCNIFDVDWIMSMKTNIKMAYDSLATGNFRVGAGTRRIFDLAYVYYFIIVKHEVIVLRSLFRTYRPSVMTQ
jgi:hypothetical protein